MASGHRFTICSGACFFPFDRINENYFQKSLCKQMSYKRGLKLPSNTGKDIKVGFLSYEVPTVAGTKQPERLDILGYDKNDHSLVAFEIKGPESELPSSLYPLTDMGLKKSAFSKYSSCYHKLTRRRY